MEHEKIDYKKSENFKLNFEEGLEVLSNYVIKFDGLKIPGGSTPFEITFLSPVTPSIEQLLVAQFEKGEGLNFTIDICEPNGPIIQKWKVESTAIGSIEVKNYSNESNGLIEVIVILPEVTIKLDF